MRVGEENKNSQLRSLLLLHLLSAAGFFGWQSASLSCEINLSAEITLPCLLFLLFSASLPHRLTHLCHSRVKGSLKNIERFRFYISKQHTGVAIEDKYRKWCIRGTAAHAFWFEGCLTTPTIFFSQSWDEFLGRDDSNFLLLRGDAVEQVGQTGEEGLLTTRLHLENIQNKKDA